MADKPILVIQTAFLGDLLLSIPLLKGIRRIYPNSHLQLVCRAGLGSILLDLGLVDEFHEVVKNDAQSYQNILKKLSKIGFLRIYCPHESFRSAMMSRSLQAERKIGFYRWWNSWIFEERVSRDLNLPDALRQLSLLKAADTELASRINDYSKNTSIAKLGEVPEWASMDVSPAISNKNIVAKNYLRVGVFPGSVWATKQWTRDGFIGVCKNLAAKKFEVILFGSAGETELAASIAGQVGGINNLVGKTGFSQTLSWLKTCDLVISNDSGGQHLAAVAGIPTLAIFGPTVLSIGYRPWNPRVKVVEVEGLGCRPCGKHGHKKCPIGTHECMKKISVDQVLKAASELIPDLNNLSH